MKRCVIVGGAEINNYEGAKRYISNADFCIYCDCGLRHKEKLGLTPSLIVGDFDSFKKPETDCEIITLPREKDDTDSFFAAKEAVKRGFGEVILLGVIGGSLDHTLANLSLLLWLDEKNINALAVDDFSEITVVSQKGKTVTDEFEYFSLLNITGDAHGVTIKSAKFPLDNGEITPYYSYAVRNEVIKGKTAEITVREGRLVLIKSFFNN